MLPIDQRDQEEIKDQLMVTESATSFTGSPLQDSARVMEPQTLVQRATDLAKFIQTQITARHEPCKQMQDLNLLLSNEFEALWLELSAVEPRAKLDFYKVVLKGTADKLLAERMIASWNVSIGQSPPTVSTWRKYCNSSGAYLCASFRWTWARRASPRSCTPSSTWKPTFIRWR